MTIDGRKIGFLYSIGADCDIDDELQKVGASNFAEYEARTGTTKTYIKLAAILNKWWARKENVDPIEEKDLYMLNAGDLARLEKEVNKAFTEGRKTSIETRPARKNAESAVKSN